MQEYKVKYNQLLKRYNNGIKFLTENPQEKEKWLPELKSIMTELDKLIKKYYIHSENILNGFEEE